MNKRDAFKLFDELPPPIAERARRNYDDVWAARRGVSFCRKPLSRAIVLSFLWDGSKERFWFWKEVADAAEYGCPYPSVKGVPS